ncbi:P-loop containing nucleoside triphosphate hydrolase protein [Radiomyces spectabilis]|uniref:P-loop containing nucleoside triphosphate hydrolase protein n=1 Tax=Radiomyces spectabilis TaxID=64574 RepID=UPI00221EFE2B|nr:P-loop containing nucleoside triphosphate hydrolase protein [Radiomyces spectabilis]KAI8393338.1 P-loop containing nucleoside triphosphate hydrolase protein [Radiomyces spectabilis]
MDPLISEEYAVNTVLLSGDAGTGKSTVLKMLAENHGVAIFQVMVGDLAADYDGRVGKGLQTTVWQAVSFPKSLIILEDVDLFFPTNAESENAPLMTILRTSLELMSRQRQSNISRTVLAGTSRKVGSIATDFRHLFEDKIRLQIPTPAERQSILQYLASGLKVESTINWDEKAAKAHAFVAADLAQWCRLAEEKALQERSSKILSRHFEETFDNVRLSSLQEMTMAEKPEITRWDDIGGLTHAKHALEESAVWIYKHADAYKRLGIRPSKGVLLYGPPGTGKTMLAKAVATESSANFLAVSIPDLVKGEVGESEKAVAKIFETAIRCSPCVIFLDELEAVFATRESSGDVGRKLISQFLIEMDHLDKLDQSVILLGATNHLDAIDKSILRPGRLDRLVYVGAPDEAERLEILRVLSEKTRVSANVDLADVAKRTLGYTGADLKAVIRKAGLSALKRRHNSHQGTALCIDQQDIEASLAVIEPSMS